MIVTITDNNIRLGKVKSVDSCPIGLAFKSLFPDSEITVFSQKVTIYKNKQIITYYPKDYNVKKFILDFDSGKSVSPITLEYYVK